MPFDTITSYVEATEMKEMIISETFRIQKLVGNAFLHSNGNLTKNPITLELKDRTQNIAYIRFASTIDTDKLDNRVKLLVLFILA